MNAPPETSDSPWLLAALVGLLLAYLSIGIVFVGAGDGMAADPDGNEVLAAAPLMP